ncbi:uncharacterized protein LOC113663393 isoform X2 [Tachysurus fulvidraco]|uniref:uncharacterized protein LOC113663393 isoform X2 n=1 Tax=Tachysurus fulvidraco TaxID=1234273 RepID=UPI001FED4835|nr:uncharacterized protein LOC113663393 isoform X2 [Tachysurus fulvidraco]
MELQKFILLILVGVFSSTLVIVIVFIIINMCVRGKAAKYVATSENPTKSSFEMSNSFKLNGQEDIRPPLPSREQFDTESMSNSYEEMPEIPMVAVETSSLQNPVHSHVPQTHTNLLDNASISESYDDVDELQSVNSYEEMTEIPMVAVETSSLQNPVHSHVPQTHTNLLDNASISESYDDIEELQRVQGISVASLPDYLDVDPPPFINGSNNGSNNVSENYDDDQLQCDSEDYDDVG